MDWAVENAANDTTNGGTLIYETKQEVLDDLKHEIEEESAWDLEDAWDVETRIDILPALKGGDSYQCSRFARATFGGFLLLTSIEIHFTSSTAVSQPDIYAQTRARPRAKTFNAPTTSAFFI